MHQDQVSQLSLVAAAQVSAPAQVSSPPTAGLRFYWQVVYCTSSHPFTNLSECPHPPNPALSTTPATDNGHRTNISNPMYWIFFGGWRWVGLGFELRVSRLQSRRSTAWVTSPVHFALVILEMGRWGGSCELFAPAGLEPWSSWSQPQAWANRTWPIYQV
jgi:hypothetical protein